VRVVVAMSGGVDSAVTAGLLVEQGHEVIGVHMKLHDATGAPEGHCCGLDDALDARRVADALQIPFYVLNLKDTFQAAVMDPFADRYLAGETPNPCVQCNGVLKFRVLLARAVALGADRLATGHYAQVREGPDGPELHRAVDDAKDQSYFLFPLTDKALQRTIFPLGAATKAEVRAHAARMALPVATKPESQEVCFIPDDDHTAFVASARPGDASGEIVGTDGRVLGRHDAYYRYTVGQRRGLGVATGAPAYVLDIDPATRRVTVGSDDQLWAHGLVLRDAHWLARPPADASVTVRIRHRGAFVPARVEATDPVVVRFETPARAVTPGQAAVVYAGTRVLGGGWIQRATRPTDAVAAP
jgi:tRNA-specific 2-thiouridylase